MKKNSGQWYQRPGTIRNWLILIGMGSLGIAWVVSLIPIPKQVEAQEVRISTLERAFGNIAELVEEQVDRDNQWRDFYQQQQMLRMQPPQYQIPNNYHPQYYAPPNQGVPNNINRYQQGD